MKIAIRYDTKTGNTQRLAEAIGQALGVEAKPVESPLEEAVDLLFLGSSVYAAGVSEKIKRFIATLRPDQVGAVVNFSTAALLTSTFSQVSKLLAKQGVPLRREEFHCRGQFHRLHRGRPNDADLEAARRFALQVAGVEPAS